MNTFTIKANYLRNLHHLPFYLFKFTIYDYILQLKRSQVQGHTGLHGDSIKSNTRTSKTGWLPDAFHPVVDTVTTRSSSITKLRADTWRDESELLQVSIDNDYHILI